MAVSSLLALISREYDIFCLAHHHCIWLNTVHRYMCTFLSSTHLHTLYPSPLSSHLPSFRPSVPPSLLLLHLLLQSVSYTCQVSGPGLHSATVNHPTHVLVELSDSSGKPCSLQQYVTAELELISRATPTSTSAGRWAWSKKPAAIPLTHLDVTTISPSQYMVSYTAIS